MKEWRGSSVAEHRNHNPRVGGSNPSLATMIYIQILIRKKGINHICENQPK